MIPHPDIAQILVTPERIHQRLDEMAADISATLAGRDVTAIVVMTGAFIFAADLLRRFESIRMHVEPVAIKSYHGQNIRSAGKCEVKLAPSGNIAGRHVLIIDDIFDSGLTISILKDMLAQQSPVEIRACSLLYKQRTDLPKRPATPEWYGFEIPDEFVVGYGLDYNGRYRELPYIGVLAEHARNLS
ncbi:MAG TPA: phosphoribosyltransferase family protein [Phycisphaerae bacterium]|nr:phosphoribosyltransferase family protein [Phycisphaerae bacterium]HPS52629.1 phosphoribosyltransferase family protein [Phycisphaerae bacterium]